MAVKKYLLVLLFLAFPFVFLSAQEEEASDEDEENVIIPDYYFEMLDDGTPLFKQIITWKEIPQAFAYELILENAEGVELLKEKTQGTSLTISIPPGNYRYCIVVYNLLDKPEIRTGWRPIEVKKAEIPVIESVSPNSLYMEEEKFQITIKGSNLLPDAEYRLVDEKTGLAVMRIRDFTNEDGETVIIQLPQNRISFGDYLVKVTNPGGISDISESGFRVRYQKPVDLGLSGGWSPFIPLYSNWVKETWNKGFYPLATVVRADLFVAKRRWGHIGPEIYTHFLYMKGGIDTATVNSFYMRLGLNCVYKYLFTPRFQLVARLGAGVAFNSHSFDYEGTDGSKMTSADFFITAGAGFQIYINRKLFIEAGADWTHIFHKNYSEGGIQPFISCGYNL